MPDKLNAAGTWLSGRVNLREIVVIQRAAAGSGDAGVSPDRLPFADGADISRPKLPSALQGRDYGD
jgi:hypothetical protein